ncbi:MAG: hypothetical protein ACYS9X_31605 [Planctomycetota bacterium]|jgi:hypothetical protein
MAETLDKNAPATDDADRPSPSPFRRFPYVQLAFCVACLSMTAWTWMRFSYCWDMTLAQLNGTHPDELEERYVRTEGELSLAQDEWSYLGQATKGYFFHPRGMALPEVGSHLSVTGRAVGLRDMPSVFTSVAPAIDCSASRFHPASVAGLVVGAMGVFVFGLYLRRWVKERRVGE